jgi:hypothetical protein
MLKYVGNCSSLINWNEVIKDCENTQPHYVGPSHKRGDNLPGLDNILDMWDNAGVKTATHGGTVEWDMFLPGHQFDQEVVDNFCKFVGIDKYKSAWISRVNIGRMTALHWDVHDDEEQLSKVDGIRRFHCHIGKPDFGHVLIVENQCLYYQEQGSTYEWNNRKDLHAGGNSGFKPKYLFNIW